MSARPRSVCVIWEDSATTHGWRDVTSLPLPPPIISIGWLVESQPKHIALSAHYNPDGYSTHHCDSMVIPRGAIKSIHSIRLPATVKKGKKHGTR